ncbi:hypothetical protein CM19_01805 [Candidatus Acidianus copahuensis]|uniref:Uncharacterized protein n=1 Tax=Candidatus Acidianus copahuensis TaxID=1160895 RepID=A0A031LUV3_9CREN|nr:hypothetical protein [Candidatus Acidianus copahuensis]EZQ11274.1 hypothetical protein CM19_01805 [Candidatus Acidianus copahuensis]
MDLLVPVPNLSKILFVNYDGNPVYDFTSNVMGKQVKLSLKGIVPKKGKHVVEVVTSKGEYLKLEAQI